MEQSLLSILTWRENMRLYHRLKLFLGIVWRRDDYLPDRIDWYTAWEVSGIIWGKD